MFSILTIFFFVIVPLFGQVSYIKAVDVYFIVSFAFAFLALMEYILVLLDIGVKRKRINIMEKAEEDMEGGMVLSCLLLLCFMSLNKLNVSDSQMFFVSVSCQF